jgi:UDP-perosamine 4-acetyltransferase
LHVSGVFDVDLGRVGSVVLGFPVAGAPREIPEGSRAILAIGDNRNRRALAGRFAGLEWVTAVHPGAYVHPSAVLGPGTVVFAGAVIQPDAVLGEHVIANTGATVDHDCSLGAFCHVAPGAHVCGGVTLGEGVLLGAGATVIPGVMVGAWSTVGAGSAVVRNVPGGAVVAGVPARPLAGRSTTQA